MKNTYNHKETKEWSGTAQAKSDCFVGPRLRSTEDF